MRVIFRNACPRLNFRELRKMPAKTAKAPAHLTPETAGWWLHVHAEFDLEMHHTRLLTLACEAFDRCGQARALIDADGPVTVTPDGGMKAHPAVAIERDARLAFARLLRELDLDTKPPSERARPPSLRSNRRPSNAH
jgi:phage terminase small subunit